MSPFENPSNLSAANNAQVSQILWLAFLATVAAMSFSLYFGVSEPEPLTLDPECFVFGFLAVTNAILSFFLPKLMASKQEIEMTPMSSSRSQHSDFVPLVVRLALAESVAVFGLLVGFMKSNVEIGMPFFVLSLFCVVMARPAKEKF